MKKYRLKKSAIIILLLIILIIIALILFIISLFNSKSYSLEYSINDYNISENYDDKTKSYYYEITLNKIKYNFISEKDYTKEKKLIKDINKYEYDNYICLTITSDYIDTMPLCSKDKELISFFLVPEELQNELKDYQKTPIIEDIKYDNYQIYNKDNNIFIWSYKGFNYLHNGKVEFIKLFDKDIYDIPLATKINNYIVVPDYTQNYNFNKLFIINTDTLEVSEWSIKYDISYDSYILGTHDKSIYLVDKKNNSEYELVPHKKKMRLIASNNKKGITYEKDSEVSISLNKLTTSNQTFTYLTNYHYIIEDNTLYMYYNNSSYKIKLSNLKIKTIIYSNKDNVYYLVDNTLYKYNIKDGEQKLVNYSEWEFNYQNLIFIND